MAAASDLWRRFGSCSLIAIAVGLCLIPPLASGQRQQQSLYEAESELLRTIFVNYSTNIPPQMSPDDPVAVKQDYFVQNILYLSERFSYMSLWIVANLSWTDQRLAWSSQTNVTKKLVVPSTDVWIPELLPWTGFRRDPSQGVKVRIARNGTVIYEALWEIDVPCVFDMTNFPFDQQECSLYLASWTLDSTKIRLENATLKYNEQFPTELSHHPDWLTNFSVSNADFDYDGETWQATQIKLRLTRKASYYYRVYVAPAAIVIFSVPLIHLLPPGSHEKMTLATLLLLCVTLMLGLAAHLFPAFTETNVPRVVLFYTADMVMLFLSMLVAAISTAVAHKGGVTRPVPRLLKQYLIDKLSFLCCVRAEDAPTHLNYLAGWLAKWTLGDEQTASDTASIINQAAPMATDDRERSTAAAAAAAGDGEAAKLLRVLVGELQYGRYREQLRLEWLQLALVIDRSLALVFFVLALIITAGFAH